MESESTPSVGVVRRTVMSDVGEIAKNLRDADRNEIKALTGVAPEVVLPECVKNSADVWTVDYLGCPHILFGVHDVIGHPDVGVVWMVSKPFEPVSSLVFLSRCKDYLPIIHGHRPILTNLVDERNTVHIRWLRWMGFSFTRRVERWGAESRPFLEFARLEPSCVASSVPSLAPV